MHEVSLEERSPDKASSALNFGSIRRISSAMPLDRRFAIVGGIISIAGMLVVGAFVSNRIETGVVRTSAISAAIYMESFIAPLSQELARGGYLSTQSRDHLQELLSDPPVSDRIVSVKIWHPNGTVVYASDPALIGHQFEPDDSLLSALEGNLVADFDELGDDEAAMEKATGLALLEVYNPIHSIMTGEVIAVAEFYQNAEELEGDLASARLTSWAIVASVFGGMFLALFGIVRAAHRTIVAQHRELIKRIDETTRVSRQNEDLRNRVQAASQRATSLNEMFLRRVGGELHDGPAQALALANLRIGKLRKLALGSDSEGEVGMIYEALNGALNDIRALSRGLILPELSQLSVSQIISKAIQAHETRSGTEVSQIGNDASPHRQIESPALAICIFRFLQEALMNAYRHAGGIAQTVRWDVTSDRLVISVSDAGPGFQVADLAETDRLGLRAMRDRIESVGGTFEIESNAEHGTILTMTLRLESNY